MAAFAVTHPEPIEKIAKIVNSTINIAGAIAGNLPKAFSNLSYQLKDAVTIFESIKIVDSIKLLCCPDENGKYFLANSKNTIQKRLDRVCLAVNSCFKTVRGLNRAGFVKLGIMAKNAIGKLPIFTLVMDAFILLSSVFSAWDSFIDGLPKGRAKIAAAKAKLEKWEQRPADIEKLKVNDAATLDAFKKKYANKLQDITKKLNAAKQQLANKQNELGLMSESAEIDKLQAEISAIENKYEKINSRLQMIVAKDGAGLAYDLEKQNITGYGGKIHKWEVVEKNAHIPQNKNWMRVANSIGKIAIVALALTMAAIYGNALALPIALTILILGTVVDSMGLTKILYDEFAKGTPVPLK